MGEVTIPVLAQIYLPLLIAAQTQYWPDVPQPHTMAGQVEQETCISMTHRKCWNPRAELKTSREYGFGLGQLTAAYRADGSVRFSAFGDARALHRDLKGWTWEERYDPKRQLAALVLMDRSLYARLSPLAATERDAWAFTLAAYNGGTSGLLKDRLLCEQKQGCDPRRWFGNVEWTSVKAKTVASGYGKSFFEINREYVSRTLDQRREKYLAYTLQKEMPWDR